MQKCVPIRWLMLMATVVACKAGAQTIDLQSNSQSVIANTAQVFTAKLAGELATNGNGTIFSPALKLLLDGREVASANSITPTSNVTTKNIPTYIPRSCYPGELGPCYSVVYTAYSTIKSGVVTINTKAPRSTGNHVYTATLSRVSSNSIAVKVIPNIAPSIYILGE